jgi:bifunctional non-homologous end joining protein LigD
MVRVTVDNHILELSNLDKVLYPQTGFTKGEILDYYARIASAMLPHIRDRAVTRRRWPDGVEGPTFFEKNAPRGKPSWVRTIMVPSPGSTRGTDEVEYPLIEHTAALIYFANLAALELHVPQWRIDEDDGLHDPDRLVIDLDPGPPASIVECCQVALALRERLAADGLEAWPKTSGGKGMQLYVPIAETPAEAVEGYAKGLAGKLARAQPDLVVATMARRLRPGKVFLDWDQNKPTKTTVAPYSLRGEPEPRVSTPVTWEEVEACRTAADLRFSPAEVLERVESDGDLLEPMFDMDQRLPDAVSAS